VAVVATADRYQVPTTLKGIRSGVAISGLLSARSGLEGKGN
jgi:hypothetical protein